MTDSASQVVNLDDQEKQHIESIAKEVGYALDKKTGLIEVQPAINQHPLTESTQKQLADIGKVEDDRPSKLSRFIPALRKTSHTTKAINFLGQKMDWLRKKSGGEVNLK